MFEIIVWVGTGLSVLGLVGLMWCIVRVSSARRKGLSDDALREVLQRVIPFNLGALLLSVLGLMLVVVGIFLG